MKLVEWPGHVGVRGKMVKLRNQTHSRLKMSFGNLKCFPSRKDSKQETVRRLKIMIVSFSRFRSSPGVLTSPDSKLYVKYTRCIIENARAKAKIVFSFTIACII